MDCIPTWSGAPGGFSWLATLLLLLGCWGYLFIPLTATWSYQRDVCFSTMQEKLCKKVSMLTVNQWPLSATMLWRLRHPRLCSPANDRLLDTRLTGLVLGTRDKWAFSASSLPGEWFPGCFTYKAVCLYADSSIFHPCKENMKGSLQGVCSRILFMLVLKAQEGIDLPPPCLGWAISTWHSRWIKSWFTS